MFWGPGRCSKLRKLVRISIPVHVGSVHVALLYMKDGLSILEGKGTFLSSAVIYAFEGK